MFHILGPDTGYDSMGDFSMARDLNGFLNALDTSDQLPKTIIYTVNPIFNEVIARRRNVRIKPMFIISGMVRDDIIDCMSSALLCVNQFLSKVKSV